MAENLIILRLSADNRVISKLELPRTEGYVIGRSDINSNFYPDVDLAAYNAGDQGVSRRHAALVRYRDEVHIVDLDSVNGTFINDKPLAPNTPYSLTNSDQVMLGDLKMIFYAANFRSLLSIQSWYNTMNKNNISLRFNGSIWCNLDIALRNVDQIFRHNMQTMGLSVIELYILRALYERDGQHASELARAVGRAATSFTPNLDKLQNKGLIERRPDPGDRRAVRIYLTESAEKSREDIMQGTSRVDTRIQEIFTPEEFEAFQRVISTLQSLEPEQL